MTEALELETTEEFATVAQAEEFATPEADRLFPPPTPEEASHALRELSWGEHIVGTRMAAARGSSPAYLYSFEDAATFFLDRNSGSVTLGSSGAYAYIDLERFVAWMSNTIGDRPFAAVLEKQLAERDAYNDKIETLRRLLLLRYAQYARYLPEEE